MIGVPSASFPSPRILPSGDQFFRLLFSNVWASAPQHCSTHSRYMRAIIVAAGAQLAQALCPTSEGGPITAQSNAPPHQE